ncbi:MAG: M15 family metallopeptidase [Saprospiraceae bacterium]|nr:M15 family metallopeptidase [Saprospiraceae bacterium]
MWKTPDYGLLGVLLLGLFVGCGSQGQPVNVASIPAEMPPADSLPPAVQVSKDYLLGKFDPAAHPDFVAVGKPYTDKPGMMLRREAFEAFQKMWESARKDDVNLRIISSTRTFDQQKAIWEGKWGRFAKDAPKPLDRARKILEYSSMPGSSRHHWGTDIDLNDLNNPSFEAGGAHEKVYQWLSAHAHEYGFCQPYIPGRPHGYQEEKWHWSYTPLSIPFLQQYRQTITNADIQGFQGAQLASEVNAVEHYVLGIGELCMPE